MGSSFTCTGASQVGNAPAKCSVKYYRHVIAEQFAYEQRLVVSTLKNHGILALLTTPENLSVDVINKYLEIKSQT